MDQPHTPKKDTFQVKQYTIGAKDILGHGAFGVVYRAKDFEGKHLAAKTIDGKRHPKILDQNFDLVLQLNHPNIVDVFDIHKESDTFWMFMEICEYGDLNQLFRRQEVGQMQLLEIMTQIMSGLKYLHGRNVIHRDIKPANILISGIKYLLIKLTDFDVSKFFDSEIETSVMSSNVGTFSFKAPEFFQRIKPGQIQYHRNVDIYAAGLTFLAMLQAKKGRNALIPRIETAQDDSELHVPSIGQLIAERIKYKSKALDVVKDTRETIFFAKLKGLIKKMTHFNPEERITAKKALDELLTLNRAGSESVLAADSTKVLKRVGKFYIHAENLCNS